MGDRGRETDESTCRTRRGRNSVCAGAILAAAMLVTEAYAILPYVCGAGFGRTERTRAGETIMVFCIGSALTPDTPLRGRARDFVAWSTQRGRENYHGFCIGCPNKLFAMIYRFYSQKMKSMSMDGATCRQDLL